MKIMLHGSHLPVIVIRHKKSVKCPYTDLLQWPLQLRLELRTCNSRN